MDADFELSLVHVYYIILLVLNHLADKIDMPLQDKPPEIQMLKAAIKSITEDSNDDHSLLKMKCAMVLMIRFMEQNNKFRETFDLIGNRVVREAKKELLDGMKHKNHFKMIKKSIKSVGAYNVLRNVCIGTTG
jgi:hypothetical protein